MQLDRLLRIVKIGIAGYKYNFDIRGQKPQSRRKLNSVHNGHRNIGDHDIRQILLCRGQKCFSVGKCADQVEVIILPIYDFTKFIENIGIIVCNHQLEQ